VKVTKLHW